MLRPCAGECRIPEPHSRVALQERRLQLIQSYQAATTELEEARRLNEELRLASQVVISRVCNAASQQLLAPKCACGCLALHVLGSEGLVPPPAGPPDLNCLLTTPLAGTFPACFHR